FLLFYFYFYHSTLHSFPTRRSSDLTRQPCMEESPMTAAPRHPRQAKEGSGQQAKPDNPPPKQVGRPKGAPSTIVNLRIPLALLADRKSTRLNSSHQIISYAVFCLKK